MDPSLFLFCVNFIVCIGNCCYYDYDQSPLRGRFPLVVAKFPNVTWQQQGSNGLGFINNTLYYCYIFHRVYISPLLKSKQNNVNVNHIIVLKDARHMAGKSCEFGDFT